MDYRQPHLKLCLSIGFGLTFPAVHCIGVILSSLTIHELLKQGENSQISVTAFVRQFIQAKPAYEFIIYRISTNCYAWCDPLNLIVFLCSY